MFYFKIEFWRSELAVEVELFVAMLNHVCASQFSSSSICIFLISIQNNILFIFILMMCQLSCRSRIESFITSRTHACKSSMNFTECYFSRHIFMSKICLNFRRWLKVHLSVQARGCPVRHDIKNLYLHFTLLKKWSRILFRILSLKNLCESSCSRVGQ